MPSGQRPWILRFRDIRVRELAASLVQLEVRDGPEKDDSHCVVDDSLTKKDSVQDGEFLWLLYQGYVLL